jgi:hypothetical protein
MKNSLVGYITFYNKNCLHYKVTVIFFFTSLINIYWLNVSFVIICFSNLLTMGVYDEYYARIHSCAHN